MLKFIKNNIKNYKLPFLALIFTLWGMILRFRLLALRDYWVDEQCHFNFVLNAPFQPFWQRLSYGSELTAFPGYYLLTFPFIKIFQYNKFWVAIPLIISTLFGFYFLYRISIKYLKTYLGFITAFTIYTFNSQLIFHSLELRPYSFLATFGLAVFYYTDLIFSDFSSITKQRKFLIWLFFILIIIFHTYGILILTSITMYFYLRQRKTGYFKENLKDILYFYIFLAIIGGLIWLWYSSGGMGIKGLYRGTFQFIPNPFSTPMGFVKGILGNLVGEKKFIFFFLAPILSFLFCSQKRMEQLGFFFILIVIPIQLILLADVFSGYWFIQRQFIFTMPLFAFFLGWCLDTTLLSLRQKKRQPHC